MLSARGNATPREGLPPRGDGSLTARPTSSLRLAGGDMLRSIRKGVDTVPQLVASGKKGECPAWSCQPDIIVPTPRTPEGRAQIMDRHKRRTEPGEITVHWGLKSTPRPDPGDGYGIRSSRGENVEDNFRSGQKLGVAEYLHSRGESIYYSTSREPLGSSYVRGHRLPETTQEKSFKGFGKELLRDDFDAKDTIFPRNVAPEQPDDKERYKQTHQDWEPGETASRKYTWPEKIASDPHFRFGIVDQGEGGVYRGNGAKCALTNNFENDGGFPKTRIVKRTSENYRQVANDQLGSARNMLQGEAPVPAGHAYGQASSADQISAAELIRGFYSTPEQQPDNDLGRCTMPGRRNFATRRPFGIPSVRTDVVAPPVERRSVANATNYGDDHSAFTLIYPSTFGCRGVTESDFVIRRSKEELRELLGGAGYQVANEDFEEIWDAAVQVFGDGQPLVSLEVYTAFLTDMMSSGAQTQRSYGGASTHRSAGASGEMNSAIEQAVEPESTVVHESEDMKT